MPKCSAWLAMVLIAAWQVLGQSTKEASESSAGKRMRPPDFDVRDTAPSGVPSNGISAQTKAILDRRGAAIEAFIAAAGAHPRITPNRFGLPKTLVRDGHVLTAPSGGRPEDIARDFLRTNRTLFPFTPSEVDGLRLVADDSSSGATFLTFNQTLDGIDVYNAQIKLTLNAAGEVLFAGADEVIPELTLATNPRLTAEQAVSAAYRSLGLTPPALSPLVSTQGKSAFRNPAGIRASSTTAELSVFPMTAGSARLAYRIFLEPSAAEWYEILIDAQSGALLFRHSLYVNAAQGRVWLQSPLDAGRQLVTFPEAWMSAASTLTMGNNVDSYLDTDGDDRPDSKTTDFLNNGRAFSANQLFDFPFSDGLSSQNPASYQAAAVTNLFYFINLAHDFYYGLGFNETAGNFQKDNFGKGGTANDAVLAEVQHPDERESASFAPTVDGVAPKIRMGIFSRGTATASDDLDSAYDGQVVFHEYAHGVSTRLVGSKISVSCLNGVQSGAMGEGWSDYFSISFYNNPVEAAYVTQRPSRGFRRFSYEGYPNTYEDIGNDGYEVHNDGEIWAATLWDLRKSLGQTVTDRLVMNGLKSTPCHPSMTDGRDAILAADLATNAGANRASIWRIFAKHGLGFSAAGTDSARYPGIYYNAAYDLPSDLQSSRNPQITSKPSSTLPAKGSSYNYAVTATNPAEGTLAFALAKGPLGMMIDLNGVLRWNASFMQERVKVTVTDGRGGKVVHGFMLTPDTPINTGEAVVIEGSQDAIGYAYFTVLAGAPILQVSLRGGPGDADLDLFDPAGTNYRSFRNGNNETLSISSPQAGRWRTGVSAYRAFSGVALTAAMVTPATFPVNTTVANLNGVIGSESFYKVTVPAGVSSLTITTAGGTGDVDLFVLKDRPAACQPSSFVIEPCTMFRSSRQIGNAESIVIASPAAGDWYIDLSAYAAYNGVSLTVATPVSPTTATSTGNTWDTDYDTFINLAEPILRNGTATSLFFFLLTYGGSSVTWGGTLQSVVSTSGGVDVTVAMNPRTYINPNGVGYPWGPLRMSSGPSNSAAWRAATIGSFVRFKTTIGDSIITPFPNLAVATQGDAQLLSAPPTSPVLSVASTGLLFNQVAGGPLSASTPLPISISGGTANWSASVSTALGGNWLTVTPAGGTGSSTIQVALTAAAAALPPGTYSGTVTIVASAASGSPAAVRITLAVTAPGPAISSGGIVGGAGSTPVVTTISPGALATIFGSAFAPAGTARSVQSSDLVNGILPTNLAGVCVRVDGKPGFPTFVSPNQLNFQVPAISLDRLVTVQVLANCGTANEVASASASVRAAGASPEFLYWLNNSSGKNPVVAINAVTGTYIGASGLIPGLTFQPAKPGDFLTIFGVSFGPTTPSFAPGEAPATTGVTAIPAEISLGATKLSRTDILYAGVSPGIAGLYQLNIRIPDNLPDGDQPLAMTIGAFATPSTGFLSVRAHDPPMTLAVGASTLTFQTSVGQDPLPQNFAISNPGIGTLNWTATAVATGGGTWLRVSPAAGVGNGSVQVSVSAGTLAAASYTGTIVIASEGALNSPTAIQVSLTVLGTVSPRLAVSSAALSFQATAGQDPTPQNLTISNSGSGTLNWTVTSNGAWLRPTPSSGTGNGTVRVGVSVAGLAAGSYSGMLTISASGAGNSPQLVTVSLNVAAPAVAGGEYRITTFAGSGSPLSTGDGGPAAQADLGGLVDGMAFDPQGNLYLAVWTQNRIKKVSTAGILTTVAGTTEGSSGDGGPATAAHLHWPFGIAVNSVGEVYIADTFNNRIRVIGLDGKITTVAGTGDTGFGGDGGPAKTALLDHPYDVKFDDQGNLIIADGYNFRIRKVARDGTISTVARLSSIPSGIAIDRLGNVYAALVSHTVVKVTPAGTASTIAGTGIAGSAGDGGLATLAQLNRPSAVAVDAAGNVFIADQENNKVRRVTPEGIISTIAGTGAQAFSGDDGPASAAYLNRPAGICLGPDGSIFVADSFNYRIRKLTRQ